jgi:hypothetical protein
LISCDKKATGIRNEKATAELQSTSTRWCRCWVPAPAGFTRFNCRRLCSRIGTVVKSVGCTTPGLWRRVVCHPTQRWGFLKRSAAPLTQHAPYVSVASTENTISGRPQCRHCGTDARGNLRGKRSASATGPQGQAHKLGAPRSADRNIRPSRSIGESRCFPELCGNLSGDD